MRYIILHGLINDHLVGGVEHLDYFSIYWEGSSQLTFIFFRGVAQPPTSHSYIVLFFRHGSQMIPIDSLFLGFSSHAPLTGASFTLLYTTSLRWALSQFLTAFRKPHTLHRPRHMDKFMYIAMGWMTKKKHMISGN